MEKSASVPGQEIPGAIPYGYSIRLYDLATNQMRILVGSDRYGMSGAAISGEKVVWTDGNRTADLSFGFGLPGDIPLIGDVTGDGRKDVVVCRGGRWFVDTNSDRRADLSFAYGIPGDVPLVGEIGG